MADDDNTPTTLNRVEIPLGGDVFTEEALSGLIGQTPKITVAFDQSDSLGRSEIIGAAQYEGALYLTLAITKDTQRRIEERFGKPEPEAYSLGYQVEKAEPLNPDDPESTLRSYVSVQAREIAAGLADQFYVPPATPKVDGQ